MNDLPPPDLGTLHGVKLPAWMWHKMKGCLRYVLSCDRLYATYSCYAQAGSNTIRIENLEPYTGQEKVSIEELKRSAYLVNFPTASQRCSTVTDSTAR